jgi:hypothetical protein
MTHELTRIHQDLWRRITALSEEQIRSGPVGQWLDAREVQAMFKRRAEMQKIVERLVNEKGSAAYVP